MSPNEYLEIQILTRANFGLLVLLYAFVAWRDRWKPAHPTKGNPMPLSAAKALIDTKTFRFNLVTTLIAIITAVAGLDWVKENPNASLAIAATLYFLQNIVLRWVTDTPVKSLMALLIAVGLIGCASNAEAGLLSSIIDRIKRPSSSCPNGQCGVQAVKPMPLPAKPSATKPVKPLAPKPPLTDAQKRAAFYQAVREGRYGEILVGNDFTPGGSDFDGPVDYIPVAPKPTPKVVK